jgi:hypothetical protein
LGLNHLHQVTSDLSTPMNHLAQHSKLHLFSSLVALSLLPGCDSMLEKLDSGWRVADPSGHHRYHRDRYYKHERKIGIRLPGDAGR